ncbi:MAG: sigma-54-dependent Fis family transcriptional regulator [Deltaproteobacteria bacterium]|nr:sigma-54-dependent Fis family transcriptional regulator [Deltaproteobacteria bacterium]
MRVLLVDDDPGLRLALSKALVRKGVDVVDLASGEAALEPLRTGTSTVGPVDVCVLDLRMPGMSGLEVLRRTQARRVPVLVLTGHGTVPDAVEAMRLGAVNFMQKPLDADELLPALQQAVRAEPPAIATALLGASAPMLSFLERLDRAAPTDEPVLLVGETGSGKELCARRLHDLSARRKGPFVVFNVASVPEEWIEGELFGQRRGATAGATETRDGALHRAGEGTLFIDDVGELGMEVQAKLLRALEERRVRPVGADADKPFRARVVAATQRELKGAVDAGRFRADLCYHLAALTLAVPPLRDRGDDVILLARAYLSRSSDRPLVLTADGEEQLRRYRFPGNVRELVNLMKRAALFSERLEVDGALLGELMQQSPYTESGRPDGDAPRAGERVTLEELEKTHIRRLLSELNNVSEVARIVGIDRRTLQRKMAAWGLRDQSPQ